MTQPERILTREECRAVFADDVNRTGVFWDWNVARLMGEREDDYWSVHVLPFGCAIIKSPDPAGTI